MGSNQSRVVHNQGDSSSNYSDDLEEDSDEYLSVCSDMDRFEDFSGFTADAAYTEPRYIFDLLNNEQIALLDNNLDQYEKISMVYLLYDNPHKAYKILQYPLNTAIREWCHEESKVNQHWNRKLLEALCIIKNYKVLRMLGHNNKQRMKDTFLPNNSLVHLYVSLVRKALFCIFETLSQDYIDRLMFSISRDLTRKRFSCYVNRDNLELTFLHLEKVGYMSLNDLRNICFLFKSIDMLTEYEHLKQLHDKINTSTTQDQNATSFMGSFSNDDTNESHSTQNVRNVDYVMEQNFGRSSDVKDKSPKHMPDTEDCYHIDSRKPGLLLIIDNEHFFTECRSEFVALLPKEVAKNKLEDRTGTTVDKDRLKTVFEELNYEVVINKNVKHDKIKEVIENSIKKANEEHFSSFFVAILSHGDKGVIYGSNSVPLEISDILETLYSPLLAGKPKVMLIQACQGERLQEIDDEYTTDGNEFCTSKLASPRTSDVHVFYATIPNYSAVRHRKDGTWFIQSLCEIIATSNKDHFEEICLKVKQDVTNKRWGKKVMVPLTTSTLTKKLYLTSEPKNIVLF